MKAKNISVKVVVVLLAVVLLFGGAIGGTLAWLIDSTDPVKNVFTYGDINIDLTESDNLDLKMIPGNTITKDPKVTVKANSEACWLFVKIEESANFDTFMTYSIADGWTALVDDNNDNIADDGVYYREVEAVNSDTDFTVLTGNKVTVNSDVTKSMLNAFDTDKDGTLSDTEKEALPTLTFTAYAIQKTAASLAADAWGIINTPANS